MFGALLDRAPHGAGVADIAGVVWQVNEAACVAAGCSKADVLGRSFWEAPWWAHAAAVRDQVRQAIVRSAGGEHVRLDTSRRAGDGSIQMVDLVVRPVFGLSGQVSALAWEAWPAAQPGPAGQRFGPTTPLVESVMELSRVPIVVVSAPDGVVRMLNEAAVEVLGIAGRSSSLNAALADVFARKAWQVRRLDGSPVADNDMPIVRALRGEVTRREALCLVRPDGVRRWILVNASPVRDSAGNLEAAVLAFPDITELKEAKLEIERRDRESELLISNMAAAFVVWIMEFDDDGGLKNIRFGYFNEAYERVSGLKLADVCGKTLREVWPETEQSWYEVFGEVARSGMARSFEMHHKPTQGTYACNAYRPGDSPDRVCVVFEDITERRKAEEETRRLANEFRTILDTLTVGVCLLKSRRVQWCNHAFAAMFGYGIDEILGVETSSFYAYREDFEMVGRDGYAALTEGRSYSVELENLRKDGSRFWCLLVGRAVDPCHLEQGSIWSLQDVTERRMTEASLRRSEARLEAAQAQAHIGSWDLSPTSTSGHWSKEMFRILGRDPELGPPTLVEFFDLVHPDDRDGLLRAHASAIESGEPAFFEHRTNPAHGPVRFLAANIQAAHDAEGGLVHTSGTLQDITDRVCAEAALRESENRFKRLIQNSNDIIAVVDEACVPLSIHGSIKGILGHEAEDLAGRCAFDFVHPGDLESVKRVFADIVANPGATRRLEFRMRHKSGAWAAVESVGTSWLHDPAIRGVVLNVRDISERKHAESEHARLQEQLQQAMKMEAVGRLAGGIAHDFNNLLTVVSGNVELGRTGLPASDPLRQCFDEILSAAESGASLTRQLLAFSRRQIIEPKVLSLNELVENTRKMLGRIIGEDVVLQTTLPPDLGLVRLDPGQFEQVLVNLAVNARDAMPDGGKLTIETLNAELDESYCSTHPDVRPGRFVMLAVSDTGQGMTEDVKRRLFEPFFTTKPKGRGTGLGLAMIFGAVKQSGGTIEVYSEPGQGTAFKIYLPRIEGQAERLSKPATPLDLPRGDETVLLVEDETSVRDLAGKVLKRLGYRVLTAPNGGEAFMLAEKFRDPIDLLMTDVVMPGMNGRELAARLRALHPEMEVLFTSGYTENVIVHHGVVDEDVNFIGKPYSIQGVAQKVRRLLDSRRQGGTSPAD